MLKDEILPFIDANGLVSPNGKTSGNGLMYTSELICLLDKRGELDKDTLCRYLTTILVQCFVPNQMGLMRRSLTSVDQEGPDDYYGWAVMCRILTKYDMGGPAHDVIHYGVRNLGNFNNLNPGWHFNRDSWLWRQPQLIASQIAARCKPMIFSRPLLWYTALVIAVSCRNTPVGDTDSRRLAWLLIQNVAPRSWLCRLAAHGWMKRLYRDYGSRGMQVVAAKYYGPEHPFAKYWITE